MAILPRPLTAEAFRPWGDVIEPPAAGRDYFDGALANLRPAASPSLSVAAAMPTPRPLIAKLMERHEFSSQSFVPLAPASWIVIVAPHATFGGPDMTRAEAFLPGPGQGITYRANVWHHPMTVFDAPARFAVFMWLTRAGGDEEFFTLPEPIPVTI